MIGISNVATRPCTDRLTKAEPWPFDLSKIDTCEEAMFAPGADMVVKALVGEETPVRVRFSCEGQQMEYVQDGSGISGQINGTPFEIQRIDLGNDAIYRGDTPAGPMQYTSTESPEKSRIKGLAGTIQYDHTLYPGEPGSGILSDMQGKFGWKTINESVTLESDGSKTVWGNLGPDSIYVRIIPAENGVLHMEGTVGPFNWKQSIEPLNQP